MMFRRLPHTLAILAIAACSDSTGPGLAPAQFGEPLSVAQFETELAAPTRIEIEFTTLTGLVAREIEVEADDAEEKITSRITAINTAAGTITLELNSLVVSYNANTRFRTPETSNVPRTSWESLVSSEIAAGRRPAVEARRPQPAAPQAPTNATYSATDLRVADDDAVEEAKMELYVDADNFEDVANPPPLAILRVFNLPVQIRTTTRIQRILDGSPATGATVRFEARIMSASASAGTLTLVDGSIINVGTATTFDAEGDLLTMTATESAVASGAFVRVEGTGTVTSTGSPRTITATTVKIEVDD